MLTNGDIERRAYELGFTDVRFERADEIKTVKGDIISPALPLSPASCIIVLFWGYSPADGAPSGSIALSNYYIASNSAYKAAQQLAEFIRGSGAGALHTAGLSAKAAALRTGGFIGDNGFYYHDSLGSLVCIQTVMSAAGQPRQYEASRIECLHCGACRKSCAAAGGIKGCVRAHMHGIVPKALRGGVYQLLGCERCQSVCPLNSANVAEPCAFPVKELLSGGGMDRLKELAGANMARHRRVLSQAALFAGGTGMRGVAEDLKRLAQSADEPVKTHALWAYEKLTGDKDDNA